MSEWVDEILDIQGMLLKNNLLNNILFMLDTVKNILGIKVDTPEQKMQKSRRYQNQIKEKVWDILWKIEQWTEYSSEDLNNFIKTLLQIKWWEVVPGRKDGHFRSKTLIHSKYWHFSSNCIDGNYEYVYDESWLPANFRYSYSIETWRSIERNKWWEVKYKKGIKGKIIC